jgi:DNA-binding NarL/FixJ family response regulator
VIATREHISLILVDDHALYREGLAESFALEGDLRVVGEANNGSDAVALAGREKPDVVLLDLEMLGVEVERTIDGVLRASPLSKVLILTMYDDPYMVRNALTLGARAYIVKNATREELVCAIRTVHRVKDRVILAVSRNTALRLERPRKDRLSVRELEVLLLVARAMSNRQIAAYLQISEGTVKRHLTSTFSKLDACSRAEATRKALSSGLITFRDLVESD